MVRQIREGHRDLTGEGILRELLKKVQEKKVAECDRTTHAASHHVIVVPSVAGFKLQKRFPTPLIAGCFI